MKNTFKKLLALFLAIVLPICLFSGCKKSSDDGTWTEEEVIVSQVDGEDENVSSEDQTGNTSSSKTKNSGKSTNTRQDKSATGGKTIGNNTKIDNPYKVDLGGATIKIYSTRGDFTQSDASVSKSSAATLKMAQTLEKQLNCKIVVETHDYATLQRLTMMGMASGDYFADIIITPIYSSIGYMTSKYVYDLSKISTMDLSKGYMNVGNAVNAYHIGSGYWAVAEPIHMAETGSPVLFNKRVLKEIVGDENYIYNLVKKGKWNLSAFRSLAKKAVKELDGKPGITTADRYGITQIDIGTSGFSNVLQTMGADMIKNNNGVLAYNMTDPKIISALNLANNIFIKDGTCKEASETTGTAQNLFMSGHSLFLSGGYIALLKKISDMDDDFGVVPFPSADGSSKYSVPANWNDTCMMIPGNLNEKQAKNAGAFIQAYCYACQDVIDVMFEEYTSRYLCDDESKENLYRCYNAQQITAASVLGGSQGELHNGTYKVLYETANGQSPTKLIQGTANATKTIVNDIYKKLK